MENFLTVVLIGVLGIRRYEVPSRFRIPSGRMKVYHYLGTNPSHLEDATKALSLVAMSVQGQPESALGHGVVSVQLPHAGRLLRQLAKTYPGEYSSNIAPTPRPYPLIVDFYATPGVDEHGDAQVTGKQPATIYWDIVDFGAGDTFVNLQCIGPDPHRSYQAFGPLPLKGSLPVVTTDVGITTCVLMANSQSTNDAHGGIADGPEYGSEGVLSITTNAPPKATSTEVVTTTISVILMPRPPSDGGLVAFVGGIPPISGGIVLSVQNGNSILSANANIELIKKGYYPEDAVTNPEAYVPLAAGQSTSAEDVAALFGTSSLSSGIGIIGLGFPIEGGTSLVVLVTYTYPA